MSIYGHRSPAPLTGAQLATVLMNELTLNIHQVTLWDRVNHFTNSGQFKVFVKVFLLVEIQELINEKPWHYVDLPSNPAEDITPGNLSCLTFVHRAAGTKTPTPPRNTSLVPRDSVSLSPRRWGVDISNTLLTHDYRRKPTVPNSRSHTSQVGCTKSRLHSNRPRPTRRAPTAGMEGLMSPADHLNVSEQF